MFTGAGIGVLMGVVSGIFSSSVLFFLEEEKVEGEVVDFLLSLEPKAALNRARLA